MNSEQAEQKLKGYLGEKRFNHSKATADAAKLIANVNSYKYPHKAYLAGLLHDIAKDLPNYKLLELAKKYNYKIINTEYHNMTLLHAPIGSLICKYELEILDQELLSAIRYHTTGKKNMSLLQKILYMADSTEQYRSYEGIEELRAISLINLNKAVYLNEKRKLIKLINQDKIICKNSLECYNDLALKVNSFLP